MRSLLLAASALAAGFSAPAFGQDAAGASDNGDIIVTARRTEEKLQDVPISITVYSQEAISARNITNAADLATYTPSLAVNSRYGPEKSTFAIRGFVQDFGTAPSVGVYFADVVAPRGASTTPSGNGVGVGNMFDLQNVQVLKGPQGTLFGRNTTGGAVLFVPKRPSDKLEGYVEGSVGNYDMWRVQGVLNVPVSDTFRVRLGVDHMKRDGYLTNHSGIGPAKMANTDYVAARLSLLWDVTPDLENYTIGTFSNSDNNGTTYRLVGCKNTAPFAALQSLLGPAACNQIARQDARGDGWWDVENSHPNPRVHMKTWQVINTTTWKASDNITVKNIFSYGQHFEDTFLNLGGDNFVGAKGTYFGNTFDLAPYILINSSPGYHYGAESTMTEELQIQGKSSDGKFIWQAGGYYEQNDPIGYGSQTVPFLLNCTDPGNYQCKKGMTVFGTRLSNMGQPVYQIWWRTKGLYAQGTYNITDKFAVTAGMRYTWDSHRHYQSSVGYFYDADNTPLGVCTLTAVFSGPGGPGTFKFINTGDFHQCDREKQTSSHRPTWMIDLEYKVVPDVLLYAKYARGYRAGGVNTPFIFFEQWGPEKVDSYEAGLKSSFRTNGISGYFNAAVFYNNFRDQQLQATLTAKVGAPSTGGTAVLNAGKSRIWGIEVDTAVTVLERLKLEAGWTYLNTRLLALTGVPAPDNSVYVPGSSPWAVVVPTAVVGADLALSPHNRVQFTATYTLPVPESVGEIAIGATFVHTDKQIGNLSSPFGNLPATNLLNLNATWRDVFGKPIDLAFFMTNVTNAEFPTNVGNLFNSAGFDSVPVNEPRMWGFRLKYRFGE